MNILRRLLRAILAPVRKKPKAHDTDQLTRVEIKIDQLTRRMIHLSEQEAELAAAIGEQGAKLDNLVTDVNRLIAAIEADPDIDLADEIAAVRASTAKITGASDAADEAVPE